MATTAFLINRMPTLILKHKSPYELIYKRAPDYHLLKNSGCSCYLNLRPYISTKLIYMSKRCAFLGYNVFHHGYRCLSLSSGCIFISWDVVFNEAVFSFHNSPNPLASSNQSNSQAKGILRTLPSHSNMSLLPSQPLDILTTTQLATPTNCLT